MSARDCASAVLRETDENIEGKAKGVCYFF